MIYMFLSNNPSSGDINLSNLIVSLGIAQIFSVSFQIYKLNG